ncbi:hypothetical protein GIB67_021048 [Kingdonia uniflora]|uniref:tRNA-uridine aminocarboxypropyltransferase n=1 Tax=Kingdonia uniflora TaxID=39325 RepID=A0A7J7N6P5_9MAGN|nr:hypothetical protein GIB67_021048 [Kingdonia uniflora]
MLSPKSNYLNPNLYFSTNSIAKFSETLTLEMGTQAPPPKRPFCCVCSKPTRLCLCRRFKTPLLDNSTSVTVLQHSLEKNHPLNSTRIAALGLKNFIVATVTDVHCEAKFLIRLMSPGCGTEVGETEECADFGYEICVEFTLQLHVVAMANMNCGNCLENCVKTPDSPTSNDLVSDLNHGSTACQSVGRCSYVYPGICSAKPLDLGDTRSEEEADITATMAKVGFSCSLTHIRAPRNNSLRPDFEQLLFTQEGQNAITNGFVVRKMRRKQLHRVFESEETEEFEIAVPPGSALLFPTKEAVSLEAVDFEVKHLIVLDGTWAKAKRMYHENPWLKLLPHLKLDHSAISLYQEVREQPKAGCLSTIESIVCALKAFGDDPEALDDILNVFESMVVDQRRCKDERLRKVSAE